MNQPKLLKSGRVKYPKPPQDTIISRTTARRLKYLMDHRLARFPIWRFKVATRFYKDWTGRLCKLPDGLPHGGV